MNWYRFKYFELHNTQQTYYVYLRAHSADDAITCEAVSMDKIQSRDTRLQAVDCVDAPPSVLSPYDSIRNPLPGDPR